MVAGGESVLSLPLLLLVCISLLKLWTCILLDPRLTFHCCVAAVTPPGCCQRLLVSSILVIFW